MLNYQNKSKSSGNLVRKILQELGRVCRAAIVLTLRQMKRDFGLNHTLIQAQAPRGEKTLKYKEILRFHFLNNYPLQLHQVKVAALPHEVTIVGRIRCQIKQKNQSENGD